MDHQMNRERYRFPSAPMRQTNVRSQHTVGESGEGLLGAVGVDRCQASEVTRVECLQKVERLRAANLTDDDPIRPMAQCGSHQVRDRDRGHRLLLAEWRLSSSRFEANEVGLLNTDLRYLFNQDNAIVRRDRLSDGVDRKSVV